MPLGQDTFSYVVNKNENNNNEYENIETVLDDKSGNIEKYTAMSETSCPTIRFFDSGTIGHDDLETSCPILSYSPKTQSSIENEESYSHENLTTSELLRRDLKNYARSEYNSVVENVPVFVGEFNKRYPGFVNTIGLHAVLDNAERLNERGWK